MLGLRGRTSVGIEVIAIANREEQVGRGFLHAADRSIRPSGTNFQFKTEVARHIIIQQNRWQNGVLDEVGTRPRSDIQVAVAD